MFVNAANIFALALAAGAAVAQPSEQGQSELKMRYKRQTATGMTLTGPSGKDVFRQGQNCTVSSAARKVPCDD